MTTPQNDATARAMFEPPGPGDARSFFAIAVGTARATIAGVNESQLDDATPCADYRVRDLLGHLVAVLLRVAAMGRGDDPFAINAEPPFESVDDWSATFIDAARAVQRAWTDPATLDRIIVLPWAEATGAELLQQYTSELTVHTWDLSTATGQHPQWDDGVVTVAYEAIRRLLPNASRAGSMAPFADAVPVADDAPLIDKLIAWNGRQP
jgi:uncharacterized protein (TIGR03086 family)